MTDMNNMNNNKRGFTYIEIILYVFIVSIFVGGIVLLAWDAIYIQIRSHEEQSVSSNLQLLSSRLSGEIRNAESISSITIDSITLNVKDVNRNPTVFSLVDGAIYLGFGNLGNCPVSTPCRLSSNDVVVTNLSFQNLSDVNIDVVKYVIDVESMNQKSNVQKNGSISSSVEVRSKDGP